MGNIILNTVNSSNEIKNKGVFRGFYKVAKFIGLVKLYHLYRNKKKEIKFKANILGSQITFIDKTPTLTYYYSYLNFGAYEPALTKKIKELVQMSKDKTFIDIGAHLGYYSLLTATWMTGKSNIIAIEPNPDFYIDFKKNININYLDEKIATYQLAFSDKEGTASMGGNDNRVMNENDTGTIKVVTFDKFCETEKIKPDIIKMDVHGAEGKIMAGMTTTLKQVSHIFCETHGDMMGYKVQDLVDMMVRAGLKVYEFTEHRKNEGGDIIPLDKETFSDHRDRVIYGIRE